MEIKTLELRNIIRVWLLRSAIVTLIYTVVNLQFTLGFILIWLTMYTLFKGRK